MLPNLPHSSFIFKVPSSCCLAPESGNILSIFFLTDTDIIFWSKSLVMNVILSRPVQRKKQLDTFKLLLTNTSCQNYSLIVLWVVLSNTIFVLVKVVIDWLFTSHDLYGTVQCSVCHPVWSGTSIEISQRTFHALHILDIVLYNGILSKASGEQPVHWKETHCLSLIGALTDWD